jgi:restriction system protein
MTETSNNDFTYPIPDLLEGKVKLSKIYINHGVMERETSFGIDMSLPEMRLSTSLQSRDLGLLPGKIEATLHNWETKFKAFLAAKDRKRKADSVDDMNAEARAAIDDLRGILAHTLDVHDAVDWSSIKRKDGFRTNPDNLVDGNEVPDWIAFDETGRPTDFERQNTNGKPTLDSVKGEHGLLSGLFQGDKIKQDYEARLAAWDEQQKTTAQENEKRTKVFQELLQKFENLERTFEDEKHHNNVALDNIRARYQHAEPKAVEEYCDLVLSSSSYPDYFPRNWTLEYLNESQTIGVNYDLPSPADLPTIESYRYVDERDEIRENLLPDAERGALYDSLVYQICIRTPHELFEADVVDALNKVVFSGRVNIVNPATGKKETKTIVSFAAEKEEFLGFDLSLVQPKATFDHLQGVAGGALSDLEPINPIMELKKTDRRFI